LENSDGLTIPKNFSGGLEFLSELAHGRTDTDVEFPLTHGRIAVASGLVRDIDVTPLRAVVTDAVIQPET
jgi:hypothetical protein